MNKWSCESRQSILSSWLWKLWKKFRSGFTRTFLHIQWNKFTDSRLHRQWNRLNGAVSFMKFFGSYLRINEILVCVKSCFFPLSWEWNTCMVFYHIIRIFGKVITVGSVMILKNLVFTIGLTFKCRSWRWNQPDSRRMHHLWRCQVWFFLYYYFFLNWEREAPLTMPPGIYYYYYYFFNTIILSSLFEFHEYYEN